MNEDKGESYVHAALRELDIWGGSQQMRDAALVRLNVTMFGKHLGVWTNARASMH